MYTKQNCYLLWFLSGGAKYVLRVVNMAADLPFWKILKFKKIQIKLDQKVG